MKVCSIRQRDMTPRQLAIATLALSLSNCGLATNYCSNIQNLPPLVDLGPGQTYHGYEGGLYPGASNVRPVTHDDAGRKIAQNIVPLSASGDPDPVNGKIVYIIASVSNGFPMWHTGDASSYGADPSVTFMTRANANPTKNPKLTIAYGFEYQLGGDNDARDPHGNFYDSTDFALKEQGLTPLQVQIVWLFFPASPSWANLPWHTLANLPWHTRAPTAPADILGFPRNAEMTKQAWKEIIYAIRSRYPNVKIIYNSTKGYTYRPLMDVTDRLEEQVRGLIQRTTPLRSRALIEAIKTVIRSDGPGGPIEPWNHDSGWSIKWLIEDQINGDPSLNYDPARGAMNAPWLSWGPYFWTYGDGTPRAYDGLSWSCGDVYDDGLHLNHSGMYKEVSLLLAQMTSDPTATPWFLGTVESRGGYR